MLSHRRETVLQGALVSFGYKWKAGTGGRYLTDFRSIGLPSTIVTQSACKAIEFGEKGKIRATTPFKVIKVIEVGTNRKPYAISY